MHHFTSFHDLSVMRYLAAELLACTMCRLFPNVWLVGGGTNSFGFFYDFVLEQSLTESMIELIEVHLRTLIKEGNEIRSLSMMRQNAEAFFIHHHQPLLAERARKEEQNILSLIQLDAFYDFCPEMTCTSTQEAGSVKLLNYLTFTRILQEKEVKVTRLIGTTQKSIKDLKNFLKSYDLLLRKKDHRLLGPQLNLFSFSNSTGDLGVFWHPKGLCLRQILQQWVKHQLPENEEFVSTPLVVRQNFLKKKSKALNPLIFNKEAYQLTPSLLRQHLVLWKSFSKNWEDLPWRITEYASIYQDYPESQWWGLFCKCQDFIDQTTIYCITKQVISELISSLHFIEQIIKIFGFEAQWYLVASRQKNPKARQEQVAIEWLRQVINREALIFPVESQLQEEEECDGPRLELRIQDIIGRAWPGPALCIIRHEQEARNLSVQQADEHSPVIVLKRQLWGSLDRLIGLLVERYEGRFPLWLAPEQVRVLAIGESNERYAQQVSQRLQQKGLRVGLDIRQLKLSHRIHEAEKEHIPYLVLLGDQERLKQGISLLMGERLNQNKFVELETFLDTLYQESLCPILKRA